jgi:hypothetical protein
MSRLFAIRATSFRSSSLIGAVVLVGCNSLTGVNDLEVTPDDAAIEPGDTLAVVLVDTGVVEQDSAIVEQDSAPAIDSPVDSAPACEASGVDEDMDLESPIAACGTDCNDKNAQVNSKQLRFFGSPYGTTLFMSSFDYDCNGIEEKRWPDLFKCTVVGGVCNLTEGWRDTVPPCGKPGKFATNCGVLGGVCYPQMNDRTQQCR